MVAARCISARGFSRGWNLIAPPESFGRSVGLVRNPNKVQELSARGR